MAVLGGLLLWPSWEPARVRDELRPRSAPMPPTPTASSATLLGEGRPRSVDAARRAAGLASNNLEATLSRALQEPRPRAARELQAAMVADAALRRIAGPAGGAAVRAGPGRRGRPAGLAAMAARRVRRARGRQRRCRAAAGRSPRRARWRGSRRQIDAHGRRAAPGSSGTTSSAEPPTAAMSRNTSPPAAP